MVAKGHRYIRVTEDVRKSFVFIAAEMQAREGRRISVGEAVEAAIDEYLKLNGKKLPRFTPSNNKKQSSEKVYLNISIEVAEALKLYGDEIDSEGRLSYSKIIETILERYEAELVSLTQKAEEE